MEEASIMKETRWLITGKRMDGIMDEVSRYQADTFSDQIASLFNSPCMTRRKWYFEETEHD